MKEFKIQLDLQIDHASPSSNPEQCMIVVNGKYYELAKQLKFKYRGFELRVLPTFVPTFVPTKIKK